MPKFKEYIKEATKKEAEERILKAIQSAKTEAQLNTAIKMWNNKDKVHKEKRKMKNYGFEQSEFDHKVFAAIDKKERELGID